jgi:hypothetical protein
MIKTRRRRIQVSTGDRYERLTIVAETDPIILSGKPCRQFLCKCDCGKSKVIGLAVLRGNRVKSCGCLHDTLPIKHRQAMGGERGLTYRTWMTMRARCLNENASDYERYGGRGIRICEQWNEFATFLQDMGERPSSKHSIDRIDPNGDYTPDNCRWATMKQQGRNRRNNRMLTFNGETLCLAEWAERIGTSLPALKSRLDVCKYTVEEALTLPIGAKRR